MTLVDFYPHFYGLKTKLTFAVLNNFTEVIQLLRTQFCFKSSGVKANNTALFRNNN